MHPYTFSNSPLQPCRFQGHPSFTSCHAIPYTAPWQVRVPAVWSSQQPQGAADAGVVEDPASSLLSDALQPCDHQGRNPTPAWHACPQNTATSWTGRAICLEWSHSPKGAAAEGQWEHVDTVAGFNSSPLQPCILQGLPPTQSSTVAQPPEQVTRGLLMPTRELLLKVCERMAWIAFCSSPLQEMCRPQPPALAACHTCMCLRCRTQQPPCLNRQSSLPKAELRSHGGCCRGHARDPDNCWKQHPP